MRWITIVVYLISTMIIYAIISDDSLYMWVYGDWWRVVLAAQDAIYPTTVVTLVMAARNAGDPRRAMWWWMACSAVLSTVGVIFEDVITPTKRDVFTVTYILANLAFVRAVYELVRSVGVQRLTSLVMIVILGVMASHHALWISTKNLLDNVATFTYSAMDIACGMAMLLLLLGGYVAVGRQSLTLMAALAMAIINDQLLLIIRWASMSMLALPFTVLRPLFMIYDTSCALVYAFVAMAALMPAVTDHPPRVTPEMRYVRTFIPYILTIVIFMIVLVTGSPPSVAIAAMVVAVAMAMYEVRNALANCKRMDEF